MSFPYDNNVHTLKLGNSFQKNSNTAFHSIRYDFKPESLDSSKPAHVELNQGQVTVTVPHHEDSSTSHTVYKGNKQPSLKECVLIVDPDTGSYTLEKLSTKITVKKSRLDGSSQSLQWIQQNQNGRKTPNFDKKVKKKPAPKVKVEPKVETKSSPDADRRSLNPGQDDQFSREPPAAAAVAEMSMSSDSDSDSDGSLSSPNPSRPSGAAALSLPKSSSQSGSRPSVQRNEFGVLNNDLALSESDDSSSDSD